jgi:hypothetical protein
MTAPENLPDIPPLLADIWDRENIYYGEAAQTSLTTALETSYGVAGVPQNCFERTDTMADIIDTHSAASPGPLGLDSPRLARPRMRRILGTPAERAAHFRAMTSPEVLPELPPPSPGLWDRENMYEGV